MSFEIQKKLQFLMILTKSELHTLIKKNRELTIGFCFNLV